MTKVFIGGSRAVSQLEVAVRQRLDAILSKSLPIVIGDANGADKLVQRYLFDRHYMNVEVYCSGGLRRNNVGGWTVRSVPVRSRRKTADFYSEKDRVMANEATIGLMLWDGQSVGTLMNVFRLLKLNKKAVLYSVPHKEFIEFHDAAEWEHFIDRCDRGLRHKVEVRLTLEAAAQRTVPRVSGDIFAAASPEDFDGTEEGVKQHAVGIAISTLAAGHEIHNKIFLSPSNNAAPLSCGAPPGRGEGQLVVLIGTCSSV